MGPIFFAFLFLRGGEQTCAYKPEWKRPNLNLSPHLTAPFAKRVCECTNTFSSFRQQQVLGCKSVINDLFRSGKEEREARAKITLTDGKIASLAPEKRKASIGDAHQLFFGKKERKRRENIMRYNCKANS